MIDDAKIVGPRDELHDRIREGERRTIAKLLKAGATKPRIAVWMGLPFEYVCKQAALIETEKDK